MIASTMRVTIFHDILLDIFTAGISGAVLVLFFVYFPPYYYWYCFHHCKNLIHLLYCLSCAYYCPYPFSVMILTLKQAHQHAALSHFSY